MGAGSRGKLSREFLFCPRSGSSLACSIRTPDTVLCTVYHRLLQGRPVVVRWEVTSFYARTHNVPLATRSCFPVCSSRRRPLALLENIMASELVHSFTMAEIQLQYINYLTRVLQNSTTSSLSRRGRRLTLDRVRCGGGCDLGGAFLRFRVHIRYWLGHWLGRWF